MITNHWVDNVNEIKSIFAEVGLPISVEKDENLTGDIDAILKLGDMPLTRYGDSSRATFNVSIEISSSKTNWIDMLLKLRMITQKLGKDNHYIFNGFTKSPDDTKLIYIGQIDFKGYADEVILS